MRRSWTLDTTERATKTTVQVGVGAVLASVAVNILASKYPAVAESRAELTYALTVVFSAALSVVSSWLSRYVGQTGSASLFE